MSSSSIIQPDWKRAEREAVSLVKEMGYYDPPVDARHIAKHLGLDVKFATFTGENADDDNAIFVNRDESPARQNFTIAHEMGHKVLHEEYARSNDYQVLLRTSLANTRTSARGKLTRSQRTCYFPVMLNRYRRYASPGELAELFSVSEQVIDTRLSYYDGFSE